MLEGKIFEKVPRNTVNFPVPTDRHKGRWYKRLLPSSTSNLTEF